MKRILIALNLAAVAALGAACSDVDLKTGSDEIIGGFPANSSRLNAIGAIGFQIPEEAAGKDRLAGFRRRPYVPRDSKVLAGETHFPYCGAVLIAPDAVLTAEQCVTFLFGDEEFLIGFDGTRPDRSVKITGVITEDTIGGGFVGLGSDLAVAFLAEEIDDLTPVNLGVLTADDVGTAYAGLGYGVRSNNGESGQRYLGQMNLRGIGGNHALNVWGSFETYLEHFAELGTGADPQQVFDALVLLEEYEATFGAAPGNAQACSGDAGGPIAKTVDGTMTVYGLASGVLGTVDNICDWGTVYTVFGPAALDFIDRALGCGLVGAETTCDGNDAVRCAPPEEGGYKVVRSDCTLVGLVCALDEPVTLPPSDTTGTEGCIDDPCENLPDGGRCDGDTWIRCSNADEGTRHTIEFDCAFFGGTCGFDEGGAVACLGVTFDSCEGNCGGAATDPEGNIVCYCDDLCTIFGDCCDDFEEVCSLPNPDDLSSPGNNRAHR